MEPYAMIYPTFCNKPVRQ